MLDDIAVRLIQGEFICQFTNPSMFNELAKEEGQTKRDINAFLAVVGRELQTNDRGTAFSLPISRRRQEPRMRQKECLNDCVTASVPP